MVIKRMCLFGGRHILEYLVFDMISIMSEKDYVTHRHMGGAGKIQQNVNN